jgi:hypothetical protein
MKLDVTRMGIVPEHHKNSLKVLYPFFRMLYYIPGKQGEGLSILTNINSIPIFF